MNNMIMILKELNRSTWFNISMGLLVGFIVKTVFNI